MLDAQKGFLHEQFIIEKLKTYCKNTVLQVLMYNLFGVSW